MTYTKCVFLYIMFNNDIKKYRLIKGCDLQLYEGVAFSPNSESQTEEDSSGVKEIYTSYAYNNIE